LESIGQLLVIDSEKVQDGGVEIVDMDSILEGAISLVRTKRGDFDDELRRFGREPISL
jgi:hypothetical protein